MGLLEVVDTADMPEYGHLRRVNAIEQGRANALDLLVKGSPLQDVLSQIIISLEDATPGLQCCIMLYENSSHSLSPLVGPSMPDGFLAALHNLPTGPHEACCGSAVFTREAVFIEDIQHHPDWLHLKADAVSSGLKACWSHPIISPDGDVFGTFAMYFPEPTRPDEDDMESLRYEAKIISIILERAQNIEQLKQANMLLEQRVLERTKELTEANMLLKKALEQRNEVRSQLVEMENMAALGTMMSSLTHEINTPIGVAITAISHLRTLQEKTSRMFEQGELKRSELEKFYLESQESADIVERNLDRSTQLIKSFKQLSIDQHSQDVRAINLCDYLDEILLSLKPRLKRTRHRFCIDIDPDLTFSSNPGALSQLVINLILNSAQHGFEPDMRGRIWLKARLIEVDRKPALRFTYRDNGKGMNAHTVENIYKPFFTMARHAGGSGLGMHICYNLVVKVLGGSIDCNSKPGKGVEFNVTFPITASDNA